MDRVKENKDDNSEDPPTRASKIIDGVEYMEMINWDDYKQDYFGKIK